MSSLQLSMAPAHKTFVELTTRVSSQDLHFRSGREESAVESVVEVFKATRTLMKDSVGADEFLQLADAMLATIRPYTARWHALIGADKQFVSPAARQQFRRQLRELQPMLQQFAEQFALLRHGQSCDIPKRPGASAPRLGSKVPLGIGRSRSAPVNAGDIDRLEHGHVAFRRGLPVTQELPQLFDGTGLALSGGGIRSATFCLGIVQVLAEKGLLPRFDYLSTVSGGGYLGSFLSNQFTDSEPAVGAAPHGLDSRGEESAPIRHLRNSSKYLLPKSTLDFLKLVGQLMSGILATALLAMVIPVLAAAIVRAIAHVIGFGEGTRDVFMATALVSVIVVALCWLVRPLKLVPRSEKPRIDQLATVAISIAAVALLIGLTPWVLEQLRDWKQWKVAGLTVSSAATLITGSIVVKATRAAWKYRRALSRLFMFSGIALFSIVYLWLVDTLGLDPGRLSLTVGEYVVLAALAVWVAWALSINLNETGLHRYYRDRLADCYLADPTGVRSAGNPPALTELSERLPYHLINTTVNLTSSTQPELRGRGGDFFLLSKFFCGSPLVGYIPTNDLIERNPDLDLAAAMAISGAAASANMGSKTMTEFRTLMAILNVRLGYWLTWRTDRSVWRSNAFVQLMRELFGSFHERSSALNLSDGGHIENLAAYELIRRRMRFIVCVDGGMDGEMTCSDLNRLQRLVAIDLGYRIEFDLANVALQNKYASDYGVLVKIDYTPSQDQANKQLGWMLYIKLGLLGTEANYVMDYRRENPLFPHQTTADQFFDEAQFEAYRKLGETAARTFFSAPFSDPSDGNPAHGPGFDAWFSSLAASMLRDTDPVFTQ